VHLYREPNLPEVDQYHPLQEEAEGEHGDEGRMLRRVDSSQRTYDEMRVNCRNWHRRNKHDWLGLYRIVSEKKLELREGGQDLQEGEEMLWEGERAWGGAQLLLLECSVLFPKLWVSTALSCEPKMVVI
jgi:hypothetical protein